MTQLVYSVAFLPKTCRFSRFSRLTGLSNMATRTHYTQVSLSSSVCMLGSVWIVSFLDELGPSDGTSVLVNKSKHLHPSKLENIVSYISQSLYFTLQQSSSTTLNKTSVCKFPSRAAEETEPIFNLQSD